MKIMFAIAALSAASLGLASQANAYKFSPPSTSFTGKGKTSATKNGVTLACSANLSGATDANGNGKVTGGSFSGAFGCSAVTFANLPWPMTATGKTTGTVTGVTFNSPIGNCGPDTLNITLKRGKIKFNQTIAGGCAVTGSLTTTPTLSIVP